MVLLLKEIHLEGENGEEFVDITTDVLDAVLLPSPDLRGDVVIDGDVCPRFYIFGNLQVEAATTGCPVCRTSYSSGWSGGAAIRESSPYRPSRDNGGRVCHRRPSSGRLRKSGSQPHCQFPSTSASGGRHGGRQRLRRLSNNISFYEPPKLGGWGSEQAFIKPFTLNIISGICACSDPCCPLT